MNTDFDHILSRPDGYPIGSICSLTIMTDDGDKLGEATVEIIGSCKRWETTEFSYIYADDGSKATHPNANSFFGQEAKLLEDFLLDDGKLDAGNECISEFRYLKLKT